MTSDPAAECGRAHAQRARGASSAAYPRVVLISLNGNGPRVDDSAWVAHSADLVGNVELRAESSVWYTAVLRAEFEAITLGERSNLQDGVVVHTDAGFPTTIGTGVSVGHRAVLHGCTIEDDCLIGMGSVVLNGAVIGAGSLVAAGAVVSEGMVVPPGSLVAGVPAQVKTALDDAAQLRLKANAAVYVGLAQLHRDEAHAR